jgi:hypothetical protein
LIRRSRMVANSQLVSGQVFEIAARARLITKTDT